MALHIFKTHRLVHMPKNEYIHFKKSTRMWGETQNEIKTITSELTMLQSNNITTMNVEEKKRINLNYFGK